MNLLPTSEQRNYLLAIARYAIAEELGIAERLPEVPIDPVTLRCGAFVTLKIDGQLRGCIGRMSSEEPLVDLIQDLARSSAFSDPRFPSLDMNEYADIEIEISLLSPLQKVSSPDEVVPGEHGVLAKSGSHSGVLLPQVAVERNWDRRTFLENTMRKAGLSPDAYLTGNVELFIFSAVLWSEERDKPRDNIS